MKKHRSSIDGFKPRRFGGEMGKSPVLGESVDGKKEKNSIRVFGVNNDNSKVSELGEVRPDRSIGRSDIDESLKIIDESVGDVKKPGLFGRRKPKHPKNINSRRRKIIKWGIVFVSVALVLAAAYMAFKFIIAGNNIFEGNIFDIFQSQALKQDSNGRSNFLILGTSEDDPGHGGANLTDSMMVVSIDQKKKDIYMFSIPRDLYVKYGMACVAGYYGKINGYFSCSEEGNTKQSEQNRLAKTQKLVGDIFGLDIQYGIHVNHSVIKEAVDAVGGIDVNIQGSGGAPGILDRNFDWRCQYTCYLVKYTNGVHHLDGTHALYLSMARGDVAPTYGLANSNFDREKNQQKILIALKDKAMSTGTLTNFGAITKLIESFGNNLRTNIKIGEIQTLMKVTSEVKNSDVHTISLFGDEGLVTTGNYNGQSVVMPSAGIYDYSEIRSFIKKNLTSDPIAKEAAAVAVYNGTDQNGYAQTKANILKNKNYNVTFIGNAPGGNYSKVEIYQIGTGNTKTAEGLAKVFNVSVKKTKPPITINGDVSFVVILGAVF